MLDVIVIGCGASGIAALRLLHYAGLNVLALEAADRIGGRIHTVGFGEGVVDIGAAWAEDKDNNAVLDLVKPFDLLEQELPDHKHFFLSSGDLVPNEQSNEILKELNEIILGADKKDTTPVLEYIQNIITSRTTYKKNPQLYESFKEWFKRANLIDGKCDPLKSRSLKSLDEFQVERDYMLHWKGNGYRTVLDIMLNKYPDPSKEIPLKILFNKEFDNLKWLPSKEPGNQTVEIKCRDGSVYEAKSVIITMSLGVLKERYSKLFNPPLPFEKANAINNMEFNVLGKIYIEFTKPWWQEIPSSFFIIWQKSDKMQLSEKEQWITGVYGLETVAHQPSSLLVWTNGADAEKMEKASEESIRIGIQKLLDMVFKKQFDVTPVKNFIRSKWATDPLTRGTIAYRSVATEMFGGSREILSEPLYTEDKFPIVCFAGEATADKHFGSVAGAIESGYREAERLIAKLKC